MNAGRLDTTSTDCEDLVRLRAIVRSMPPPPLPSTAELLADTFSCEFEGPDLGEHTDHTLCHRIVHFRFNRNPIQARLASVTLALAALILLMFSIPLPSGLAFVAATVYATGPGEQQKITLKDRSVVTLSGSAELKVLFSEHRRRAFLTRGEAFFQIKDDPEAPPFEVDAGSGRISDLGTEFDVRKFSDNQVTVTVAQGEVVVTPQGWKSADGGSGGRQRSAVRLSQTALKTGETVTYDARGEIGSRLTVNLEAVKSWLYGHRLYEGQPLEKVIEDVQLYTVRRIVLDPPLLSARFTGYFDQSRADQWVLDLPKLFPVWVDTNSRHLFVHCRSRGCPELRP